MVGCPLLMLPHVTVRVKEVNESDFHKKKMKEGNK